MRRPWLYASLALLAASLVVTTGSFTAVSADRAVHISVADDSDAFVGIEEGETTARIGKQLELLYLEDNFGTDDTAVLEKVTVGPRGGPVTLPTWHPEPLDTSIVVRCRGPTDGAETVTVNLLVKSDGMTVKLDRTVAVTCEMPPESEGNNTDAPADTSNATT
jgi:hypothetical protein